jgi:tight adherence protein B
VAAALVSALCAVGVMLLGGGIYRLRRRGAASRRVSAILAQSAHTPSEGSSALEAAATPPWRIELRQAIAQIEARDSVLRVPTVALGAVSALIGLASFSVPWIVLAVLAGVAAYALGARDRRRRRIETQTLDAMQLFASGLRAGYSVAQAIALVAKHSPKPTAEEFALAAQEISVGVQLADALQRLSKRTANSDYNLVSIIVRVQHEVGGNLAQILDSVGNTLRERFELRRQVNALTAQQRLSSTILTFLPFGLLAVLFFLDRSFVDPLFTQPMGRVILASACGMVFVGWTIMRSMGRVEV